MCEWQFQVSCTVTQYVPGPRDLCSPCVRRGWRSVQPSRQRGTGVRAPCSASSCPRTRSLSSSPSACSGGKTGLKHYKKSSKWSTWLKFRRGSFISNVAPNLFNLVFILKTYFTPSESKQDQRSTTKVQRIQETSKKKFSFAFARSEHSLRSDKNQRKMKKGTLKPFSHLTSVFAFFFDPCRQM